MNWQGEAKHFVLLIGNDLIYTGVIISTASLTVKKKKTFPVIMKLDVCGNSLLVAENCFKSSHVSS